MAKQYGYNAMPAAPGSCHMFGEIPTKIPGDPRLMPMARGIQIGTSPFACCGLSTICAMSGTVILTEFPERAAWLAALWNTTKGRTHYVYVVNPTQDRQQQMEHGALLACGAQLIAEFPNLQPGHSGYNLKMYMVNLNDGIGRFFDANGYAYTEPPKVEPTAEVGKTIKVKPVAVKEPKAAPKKETA